MLNIDGEKMSKSLNNFRTLGSVLEAWDPRALRLAMLQTHYRKVMELGDEAMEAATSALERIDNFRRQLTAAELPADAPLDDAAVAEFTAAMNHDFGTPSAVATIFDLVRKGNAALQANDLAGAASALNTIDELTGVLGLEKPAAAEGDAGIDQLVADRQAARDAKDFAESDRIRDLLAAQGIEVEDTANGPVWRRIG